MKIIIKTLILILIAQVSYSQMINLEQYVTGISNPTDITNAGDDRLFVVERGGKVKIIDNEGNVLPTPFIDIDDLVSNASGQSERGLLGIAFHPDYANNGYFFLNHTDNDDHTNVVRYQVDPANPDKADPSTRELIILIEQPYGNHNGGGIKFGPDGYLYIGMGDGGSANDPQNYGQNKQSLLGKMLRLDVDNDLPYTIPADNPFVGDDTTMDEIWAIGMRNPWRFSFDRMTGDLWIGDVGQGAIEEVDFEPAGDAGGHNYGWRCYEGTDFTNLNSMADCNDNYVDPVYEIPHQGFSGPCSITGGYMYRGTKYTDILGHYICTDYCTGDFYTVTSDGNGGWQGQEVATLNSGISTFGEDVYGELYVATLSGGRIYKVLGGVLNANDVIQEIEEIVISPNPVYDNSNLKIESNESITVELTLVDLAGKVVLNETVNITGVFNKIIDLSDHPSGTYILNVNTDKGLVTKKIIKQ
jgi:glucose/arabinose dehydrogenase